jgi:poly(A) polymerase
LNKKNKASSVKTPKILKENKFSPLAIEVVKKLKQSGFQGYLVGGCVRDSLVGIKAKDLMFQQTQLLKKLEKFLDLQELLAKDFAWFMFLAEMN